MVSDQPDSRLATALRLVAMSDARLARLAGTSKQQIYKLKRRRQIDRDWAERLAPHLGVTGEWLAGWGEATVADNPDASRSITNVEQSHPLSGFVRIATNAPELPTFRDLPQDVPVYGTAEAGAEGTFIINMLGGPIGWAFRGPAIVGLAGVFAILIEGDSMVPWRRAGSLAYVHETRPPAPGCHVVVELDPGPGQPRRAIIKELVRRTASKLELKQHNPPATIELDMATVVRVLRVLEWEDVMGF